MNQDLVIASPPRAPRTARYAYKPNRIHTMTPPPVALAEFGGGEKIRMAFWQPIDKPWRTEPVKQWLAQIIGNERGRAGKAYSADIEKLQRRVEAARALMARPGSAGEGDAAKRALARLTKAEKAAAEKAAMAAVFTEMNVLTRVFPPATDMTSFHIEHEGRRIDPATIENPWKRPFIGTTFPDEPSKNLSGGRRTRKSAAAVSIPGPRTIPASTPAVALPSAIVDTVAKVDSALGAEAVDAFLHAMNEFLARPGKVRALKAGGFTYRIHVHKKEAA